LGKKKRKPLPELPQDVAYFDSHCHLDPDAFDDAAGVGAAIGRARAAGVGRMLAIGSGYGVECASRALKIAEAHPDIWAAVGIHPHDAKHHTAEAWAEVTQMLHHPRVVAVGEMGLDFHYDNSPRQQQREVLRIQVRTSLELDLPIIIHDRESDGECLQILQEERAFSGRGVVWHCFTGDVPMMEGIVEAGGHISLSGIVSFGKAEALHAVAQQVPLDRLFIETDSPFLAPEPLRGRRNEPAYVPLVAHAIAQQRGIDIADLAKLTWANASRFFRIPEA
jgi:TatD DNase family protein